MKKNRQNQKQKPRAIAQELSVAEQKSALSGRLSSLSLLVLLVVLIIMSTTGMP